MARRAFTDMTHFTLAGERLLAAAGLDPRTVRTEDLPTRPEHDMGRCYSGDDVDRCARCHRQNAGGLKTVERARFVYSVPRSRVGSLCALCGEPGAWNLPRTHPARLEAGHLVSVHHYGSAGARNLVALCRTCNADAGDTDLRPYVAPVVAPWPSGTAAVAFDGTPWHLYVGPGVAEQTAADRRAARARIVLTDESGATFGIPF